MERIVAWLRAGLQVTCVGLDAGSADRRAGQCTRLVDTARLSKGVEHERCIAQPVEARKRRLWDVGTPA